MMWPRIVFWVDEYINHLNPFDRPLSRRLCDYNDYLITGQKGER